MNLIHTFALHDQLQDGASMYQFMIQIANHVDKLSKETHNNLIHLIWTFIYRDTIKDEEKSQSGISRSATDSNPLIPRLIEHLYNYKREAPLTRNEYLMLFQINIWLEKQLDEGRLPDNFKGCIPSEITEVA